MFLKEELLLKFRESAPKYDKENTFSYEDYEEAYCHLQYHKCKEIGVYILSKQKDKYSKKLLKKLKKFDYDLLHQDTKNDRLLWEIKAWLMVNSNYF